MSRRALGGRSAGTRRATVRLLTMSEATAINRRREFISVEAGRCELEARRFCVARNAAKGLAYPYL